MSAPAPTHDCIWCDAKHVLTSKEHAVATEIQRRMDEIIAGEVRESTVRCYGELGWRVVLWEPNGLKGPTEKGWPDIAYSAESYRHGMQVGIVTGVEVAPGSFLHDVDLDWQPGIPIALAILPPTEAVYGRASKRASHALYLLDKAHPLKKYEDIDGTTLLELRGTSKDGGQSCQSLAPPSYRPDQKGAYTGEPLAWTRPDFAPTYVPDLPDSVLHAAIAMLLFKHLPNGAGHDARIHLAGFLLKTCGLSEDAARSIAMALVLNSPDHKNPSDMSTAVSTTAARVRDGKRVSGKTDLARAIGEKGTEVVTRVLDWVKPSADEGDDHGQSRSAATKLVNIVLDGGVELFCTPDEDAHAVVPPTAETLPLASRAFRSWLSDEFFRANSAVVGGGAVADAVTTLAGEARRSGVVRPVYTRVAATDEAVYLDLGRPDRRVLAITGKGWTIDTAPVGIHLVRRKGALMLPDPVQGRPLTETLPAIITVQPDSPDLKLLIGWLVAALRGVKPYPVLAICGEQGTTKSSACRIIRGCIDPSTAGMSTTPREARDLFITALNSHVLGFDNLSVIPDWLSDVLCCFSTGGGYRTRLLTTDQEETIFAAARPVVLNSIAEVIRRGDLLDRTLTVNLEPLAEDRRRTEADVDAMFGAVLPEILGALADAVSQALRAPVTLDHLPRMADFAVVVESAAPALGWKPGEFLAIYERSRSEATAALLDGDVVADALLTLHENDKAQPWEGTLLELLVRIRAVTPEYRRNDLPSAARGLAPRLARLAPALRKIGIDVQLPRRQELRHGRRERVCRIVYPGSSGLVQFEEGAR